MQNKLFCKKKTQINNSKQKVSLEETNSRKAIISILNSLDKRKMLVSILAIIKSEPKTKDIDIIMMSVNTYCTACGLKKA